ncbi:MAG: histidinol phosphate phosphatase domain-containing protein [Candidatus Omnitrophota bacterium]
MIDLHTHTFLSDGVLIPSELVRRAYVSGYKAIALTDHVDYSNIETVLSALIRVSVELNKFWEIVVLPGVEITHVPVEVFSDIVKYARDNGAKIIVGHGESPVEPVIPGTNTAAIKAGVDILAHPGYISEDAARLAGEKGVFLEITARKGHSKTNAHVFERAVKAGAHMVLNTDAHAPDDLLTVEKREEILSGLTDAAIIKGEILRNSEKIVEKILSNTESRNHGR